MQKELLQTQQISIGVIYVHSPKTKDNKVAVPKQGMIGKGHYEKPYPSYHHHLMHEELIHTGE